MKHFTILLVTVIFIASCGKKYTSANLPREFVEIGSGGGFTGVYNYYKLTPSGQIFKTTSGATGYSEIGKISKKIAKSAIKSLNKVTDSCAAVSGNMNYFVFLGTKDTMYNWIWSDSRPAPSAAAQKVYNLISQQLEAINNK